MKRIKDGDPLFPVFMKTYYEWYRNRVGVPPKIDVADGKSLKHIIKYFRGITDNPFVSEKIEEGVAQESVVQESENKNTLSDKNLETVNAWDFIFANYDKWDKFYQRQLSLRHINSNLNNIINSIKNGQQGIAGKSIGEIREQIGDID